MAHRILVAGPNFGTGSSREHAVWALAEHGFLAVLAPRLADIFRNNALVNGLLAANISDSLFEALCAAPEDRLDIDLDRQLIAGPQAGVTPFEIDPFAKDCLQRGVDRFGYLLALRPDIEQFERRPT